MNKKKSTGLVLSILGVLSLVLITAGVTYAFFTYAKLGTTENVISTGTITFIYNENSANGSRSIAIENAKPISDEVGKALSADNEIFDFSVSGVSSGTAAINYEITAKSQAVAADKKQLPENKVKLYLEEEGAQVLAPTLYSALTDSTGHTGEKTLYTATVPAGTTTAAPYTKNYTLRMWLAEADVNSATQGNNYDYTPYEFKKGDNMITAVAYYALADKTGYERIVVINNATKEAKTLTEIGGTEETRTQAIAEFIAANTGWEKGEQLYMLNNQSFKVTVNVYANAQ